MRLKTFNLFYPEGDNPVITDSEPYYAQRPMTGRGSRGGGRAGRGSRGGRVRTINYHHGESDSNAVSNSAEYTRRLLEVQQRIAANRNQHLQQVQRGPMPVPLPLHPPPPQRKQEFSVDPFRLYAKVVSVL